MSQRSISPGSGPFAAPSATELPRALFTLATSAFGAVDRARNSPLAARVADVAQASLRSAREGLTAQAALAQESLRERLQSARQGLADATATESPPVPFRLSPPTDDEEEPDWDVITRGDEPDWDHIGEQELWNPARNPDDDEETLARKWKAMEKALNQAIRFDDKQEQRILRRSMSEIRHRLAFFERVRVEKMRREGELWEAQNRERGEMLGFKRDVLKKMGASVFKRLDVREKEEEEQKAAEEEEKAQEEESDEDDGAISGFTKESDEEDGTISCFINQNS